MTEPYLTNDQLAARWGLQPAAIKNQRARGIGLVYYTIRVSASLRVHHASAVSIISSPGL
jgi:hypothetical protein